ncbi:MAG: DNA-binding response regulator [Acidobacteria bacterium]|nr:MAG: DNA-binding response regulator [Acidobacteriota bacterium]
MRTILLVEDEPAFSDAISLGLQREGYSVVTAVNGSEALAAFKSCRPDMVLLDLMLPGRMSGIDVCREIRRDSDVPIIVVTARGSEVDSVVLLEIGADDFVRKPFGMRELIARIRAVLRRAPTGAVAEAHEVMGSGDVIVDTAAHKVTVSGEAVQLPRKEFDLLCALVENAGRVMTRQGLIDRVWGYDYVGDTKTLDVHIKRLRAKIEKNPAEPARITTVRGVGYKFEPA